MDTSIQLLKHVRWRYHSFLLSFFRSGLHFPPYQILNDGRGIDQSLNFRKSSLHFFFLIMKGYLETAFIGFLLQNILGLKKKSWIQKGCMHFFCNWVVADRATRAEKSASVTDSSHSLLFGLLFIFVTNEAINLITDNLLQPFVSLRSFIIRHTSLDSKHWRALKHWTMHAIYLIISSILLS